MTQFLQSYLLAWFFWTGLSLGALALLMLQYVTGGAWGEAIRARCEAAAAALPALGVLFVPILLGVRFVYPWARPDFAMPGPHERIYLSVPFFVVRTFLYFGVFSALALLLRRKNETLRYRLSAGGLVAYVLCMNFASIDWLMSLEPKWPSTIFVIILIFSHVLPALALMTALHCLSPEATNPKALHDLGNLLLAFTIFWTYVSFSQFLIIWNGNLPKEISWYLHRRDGGWTGVVIVLAALQFFLPFALLLSRTAKRHATSLLYIAGLIFVAAVLNAYWLIVPSFHPQGLHLHVLDILLFALLGAGWCYHLKRPLFFRHA